MAGAKPILIIEDDREIAEVIAINLRDLGFATTHAADGASGLRLALEGEFALVILDIMLPEVDGLEVCRRLRAKSSATPIIMLTARSEELDRILGLELGADEYVTKPFSVRELMARVKALLRRVQADREAAGAGGGRLEIGNLVVDIERRRVTLGKRVVELTVKEFDLLCLLAGNPGRTYSRTDLLNLVWGYQFDGYDHTVNTHINRLRGKIEADPAHPRLLRTVWGVGYRFADPRELEA